MTNDWGEPRSKVVTWYDPLTAADSGRAMTGLEHLEALRDGVLPPPAWVTPASN